MNVLVFRVGLLGDTIAAMPTIQVIRRRHPDHRLMLLTAQPDDPAWVSAWSLLRETAWIDEVVFYDAGPRTLRSLVRLASLTVALRGQRFQSIYNLAPQRSPRQARRDAFFFRHLIGAETYFSAPPWRSSHREEGVSGVRVEPEALRLLRIVDRSASRADVDGFRLPVPLDAVVAAQEALSDAGFAAAPLVAIAPGARLGAKRWPERHYAIVGSRLLEEIGDLRLAIIGGPQDRALGERLCASWGSRAANLAGRLSVYGSAAVLARCALYIGNDSGPMHLAASVGTPCVALFSAREAEGRWEPSGEANVVLRTRPECAGCMLEECVEEHGKCLTRISIAMVLDAARRCLVWRLPHTRTHERGLASVLGA